MNNAVIGDKDPFSDIVHLYDRSDTIGFSTATPINSNSNTYHRLTLNFTQKVNIQKIAIRGRQISGYYGFVFILRDENNNIIYVHRATNDNVKGIGADENAISTYSFLIDEDFPEINDFSIDVDYSNISFEMGEGTTTNILGIFNNITVANGYEYERIFVALEGIDLSDFDIDDLVFRDNELKGLSFKTLPDYEKSNR